MTSIKEDSFPAKNSWKTLSQNLAPKIRTLESFSSDGTATRDLRSLAKVSAAKWSDVQTGAYLQALYEAFQHIANRHERLPQNQKLTGGTGLQLYRTGSHYVVFKLITPDTIAVVTVLHVHMDVPTRLREMKSRISSEIADIRYKVLKSKLEGED